MIRPVAMLALLALLLATGANAWPGTPLGRVEAVAVVQGLNVALLTHDSATATLEAWCASHRLAPVPRIVARAVGGADTPADAPVRAALRVGPDEPVRHRRVALACGDKVLSDADNWYVPARLTPEMNRVLETTDTPFGKAVAGLDFRRRTLSARLLLEALPEGWETAPRLPGRGPLVLPEHVLEHQAVLSTRDGVPFSLVVERYTREVLGFSPPDR